MLNDAYTYLINKTSSIASGYSERFPSEEQGIVFRSLGGTTSKTLTKKRMYSTYSFNVIVRGGQYSAEVVTTCNTIIEAIDLDTTGIIQCNVTSEPSFAYIGDNGNIHYTFNVDVII